MLRGEARQVRTVRACAPSARSQMLWCATSPLGRSPPAPEPRPRCSKFGFGKVPGGGYQPERSRGEILCFFVVGSFLMCVLSDCPFPGPRTPLTQNVISDAGQ